MFSKEFLIEITTKRFEYTYEAMWKCARDLLRERGVERGSPKSCFGGLIREGLIPESLEPVLAEIIRIRNELVHVYDAERAEDLFQKIKGEEIFNAVREVYRSFKNLSGSEEL